MPIKWSAVKVSEAMDMAEEFVNQVDGPLEQARIVVKEAREIADLPQYLDQRLVQLICGIDRMDCIKDSIEGVRKSIPDGAIEAERERLRHGATHSLM